MGGTRRLTKSLPGARPVLQRGVSPAWRRACTTGRWPSRPGRGPGNRGGSRSRRPAGCSPGGRTTRIRRGCMRCPTSPCRTPPLRHRHRLLLVHSHVAGPPSPAGRSADPALAQPAGPPSPLEPRPGGRVPSTLDGVFTGVLTTANTPSRVLGAGTGIQLGAGDVHHVRVPVPGRPGLAGQDDRTAGDCVVPAASRGRGTVDGHRQPGRGRALAHLDPGAMRGRDATAGDLGGRGRRGHHVPCHSFDRGEGRQSAARASRPGAAPARPAATVPQGKGLREPGAKPG